MKQIKIYNLIHADFSNVKKYLLDGESIHHKMLGLFLEGNNLTYLFLANTAQKFRMRYPLNSDVFNLCSYLEPALLVTPEMVITGAFSWSETREQCIDWAQLSADWVNVSRNITSTSVAPVCEGYRHYFKGDRETEIALLPYLESVPSRKVPVADITNEDINFESINTVINKHLEGLAWTKI